VLQVDPARHQHRIDEEPKNSFSRCCNKNLAFNDYALTAHFLLRFALGRLSRDFEPRETRVPKYSELGAQPS
jgi:hypothetical protein